MQSPPSIATKSFTDAALAVARLEEIYERNTKFLRDRFEAYVNGEAITTRVRAYYPFVRVTTATYARLDSRLRPASALCKCRRGLSRRPGPLIRPVSPTE